MSLNLDTRQRAMLAEMGVRVWTPEAAVVPVPAIAAIPARALAAVPKPAQETPESIALHDPSAPGRAQKQAETPAATRSPAVAAPLAAPAGRVAHPAGIETLDWPALQATVSACQACGLCQGRTQTVFGVGDRGARWMVVGEAPGEREDLQGEPFVGPSGQLLDNTLRAIGLNRQAGAGAQDPVLAAAAGVYIANVIKCRPPGNRNPQPEEVAQCEPYLARQVALVRPKLILAMGRFAVQALLHTTEPLGKLRGRVHRYEGVPVIVTYHPAYLLRNLPEKAKAWADLCLALEVARELQNQ